LVAIEYKQPEIVSLLISHGANIDIKIYNNGTPLHVVCIEETLDTVKTLVNNDSCIKAETYYEQIPLFYCLGDIVQTGLQVYLTNKFHLGIDHKDLASYVDSIQERKDIMEYLIKKGATLSCKDDSGRTPLEYAWITCMI